MSVSNVTVVTGGSTGIGAEICRRLLADDHHVISLSRRPAFAHARLESVAVDLLDPAATAEAARDLANRYAITHLIHNAGAIRANLIENTSIGDLAALNQLHLGVPLALMQAALPSMKARAFGRVVLISSRAAMGLATRTVYAATKSGMIGMARTWALELGKHGITVNVVAPGPIEGTEMFHDVIPAGDARLQALAKSIPVQRLGTPQDVARAVAFFTAPDAGFVTGQVLYVCGGASVGAVTI